MSKQQKFYIPLLNEVRVKTAPMPLYFAYWRGFADNGLIIRQSIAKDLGLNFLQRENVRRGVLTIWGKIPAKDLISSQRNGAEEWLKQILNKINLAIQGSTPIQHLQLCRCTKTRFLAYYSSFYANYMEIVIYIDSGSDIDGATVEHLERSKVDETTRDWKRLIEQLPLEIWIKEA